MSATHPDNPDRDFEALRRAQRAHEPSMEEILASIRAIISEDREGGAPRPAPAPVPAAAPSVARPVGATGPQIVYSNAAPVAAKPVEPASVPKAAEPAAPPTVLWARKSETPPPLRAVEPAPAAPQSDSPLLSSEVDRAVSASFGALSASLSGPGPEAMMDMTRNMLRPMIKTWLDENLPALVERLVRAEIERVARGGR